MTAIDRMIAMMRERRVGFSFREVMEGSHEFEPGCGPPGRFPMAFRVSWGVGHLSAFLDPRKEAFLCADLEGRVTIDGLCASARCQGSLELRYFKQHAIIYRFRFEAGGRPYHYLGQKVNIRWWNLPVSHTTCFGTLTEADTGKLVSRSVTFFRLWRAPGFLASFRLT